MSLNLVFQLKPGFCRVQDADSSPELPQLFQLLQVCILVLPFASIVTLSLAVSLLSRCCWCSIPPSWRRIMRIAAASVQQPPPSPRAPAFAKCLAPPSLHQQYRVRSSSVTGCACWRVMRAQGCAALGIDVCPAALGHLLSSVQRQLCAAYDPRASCSCKVPPYAAARDFVMC
jgi:hypothetical protein